MQAGLGALCRFIWARLFVCGRPRKTVVFQCVDIVPDEEPPLDLRAPSAVVTLWLLPVTVALQYISSLLRLNRSSSVCLLPLHYSNDISPLAR